MLHSVAAIVLLALVLNACGTRGALYLPPPEQKPPQQEPSRK